MPIPFKTSRRVEFHDTDAAGIMHFSAFFRMLEVAEHELLRSLGLSVFMTDEAGPFSWPRVHASCDYRGAVRFEDVVEILVDVERLGAKSVTYRFRLSHQGREVAEGRMTSVCCRLHHDRPPQSIPIPAAIAEKLRPLVVED